MSILDSLAAPAALPELSWVDESSADCTRYLKGLDGMDVDDDLRCLIGLALADKKAAIDDAVALVGMIRSANRAVWKQVRKFARDPMVATDFDLLRKALLLELAYAEAEASAVRGLIALAGVREKLRRIDVAAGRC